MNINQALQLATSWMDSIEGVTGVAQGLTEQDQDAVIIYVTHQRVADKLPADLDGVPIVITVSGKFEAL